MQEHDTGRMWEYMFTGQWLSLNAVYSAHYRLRHQTKLAWQEKFTPIIRAMDIPLLGAFRLEIRYNSRQDTDNLTGGSKIFVDTLRHLGVIVDDTKHVYRGIWLHPDTTLPHNSYELRVVEVHVPPTPPKIVSKKALKTKKGAAERDI